MIQIHDDYTVYGEYILPTTSLYEDEMVRGKLTELIHCRDCKYHYYHEMLKQDYCEITNMQFGEVEPNGYCHRAERKEE